MIFGYVFSRKDNKEMEIIKDSFFNEEVYYEKIYNLIKPKLFKIQEE